MRGDDIGGLGGSHRGTSRRSRRRREVLASRTVKDLVAGSGISSRAAACMSSRASPGSGSCTWRREPCCGEGSGTSWPPPSGAQVSRRSERGSVPVSLREPGRRSRPLSRARRDRGRLRNVNGCGWAAAGHHGARGGRHCARARKVRGPRSSPRPADRGRHSTCRRLAAERGRHRRFWFLGVAQIPIGVGIAVLLSAGVAGAGEWAPPGERVHVLSWALVGPPVAWIVGMPVIGVVAEQSWRLAFVAMPLAARRSRPARSPPSARQGRPSREWREPRSFGSFASVWSAPGRSVSSWPSRPGQGSSSTRERSSSSRTMRSYHDDGARPCGRRRRVRAREHAGA